MPWGRLECIGLGCEHCDAAKVGAAFLAALEAGMADVDRAVLGSAYVPPEGVGTPTG